jgi:hypothetical protein
MLDLQTTICDVYDLVNEALSHSSPNESQRKVLSRMSQQVLECAYFIRDEFNTKNFCKYFCHSLVLNMSLLHLVLRATKNALIGKQLEETIQGYIKTFEGLQLAFMERGIWEAQITTLCIFRTVSDICMYFLLANTSPKPKALHCICHFRWQDGLTRFK